MSITPIFTVIQIKHEPGSVTAHLGINPDSEILNGHFPGQPVVPGAGMLQMVKEVLETALDRPLRLKTAQQLKFISLIDPRVVQTVQLHIGYTMDRDIAATAKLICGDADCFKFQGTFISG